MAIFSADCPHCHTKQVAFQIHNSIPLPGKDNRVWNEFAICGQCGVGVVAIYHSELGRQPGQELHNHPDDFTQTALHPKPESPEAPQHLPENVEKFFLQAVENKKQNFDAAGAMYRKSLDVGLKEKFPDIKGNLKSRIEKAAKKGAITTELGKWAHHIRLEGNDASHDEDPYSDEEVVELHRFTELVLMYLFTLPGMLEEAKGEDDEVEIEVEVTEVDEDAVAGEG